MATDEPNTEPKVETTPLVPYSLRPRAISDNTYAVYCSYYRRAKYNWETTKNPAYEKELKKWERNILRAGRVLPVEKEPEPLLPVVETPQEQLNQQAETAVNAALVAMVKSLDPTVDITDPKAVQEAAKRLLKRQRADDPPVTDLLSQ